MKLPEYFTDRIVIDGTADCWLWVGARNAKGYGTANYAGRFRLAHRVTYEMAHGAVPRGMQLDHLCRMRSCVNSAHLEPVTPRENILRGRRGVLDRSGFTSPYAGVCRHTCGKWVAKFCVGGASHYVGVFNDDREAALAYDEEVRAILPPGSPTNASLGLLDGAA